MPSDTVYLPPAFAEIANECHDELVHGLLVITLRNVTDLCRKNRHVTGQFQLHSLIALRYLGGSAQRYKLFHEIMSTVPIVTRNEHYLSYHAVGESEACCKAYHINGLPHERTVINIIGRASDRLSSGDHPADVPVTVSPRAWTRLRAAFMWYALVYLPDLLGKSLELVRVLPLLRAFLKNLDLPSVGFDEVLAVCGGDKSRAENAFGKIRDLWMMAEFPVDCWADSGGRAYHKLVEMKREIRRKFMYSDARFDLVEMDQHASFIAIIAGTMAKGDEKQRLIQMIATGDFYGEFAILAGVDRGDVKRRFQKEVIFMYRSRSVLWCAFAKHFPATAAAIKSIRDGSDVIVNVKEKYRELPDGSTRKYLVHTRFGQRRLSRMLSRVESQIFLTGALLTMFRDHRMPAIPVHDCLAVIDKPEHIAAAVSSIQKHAVEFLGFCPPLKLIDRHSETRCVIPAVVPHGQ